MNTVAHYQELAGRTGQSEAEPSVVLSFPDVNGVLRGKAFSREAFESICRRNGTAFTNLLLALDPLDNPITSFREFGISSGAADLIVRPDLSTKWTLPWSGEDFYFGDLFWDDGRECALSARATLKRTLDRLNKLGLTACGAFEFEVRVFTSRYGEAATDGLSYSVTALSPIKKFIDDVRAAATSLELDLSAVHTEGAPGLLEINLDPKTGVAIADTAILLRMLLKEVGQRHGLHVSFMAKPVAGEEGSSGHLHCSLQDKDGNNVFAHGNGLGVQQSHAIAGIVKHLPAMSLLYNPTINSYKRLVPGFFAPVNAAWGVDNRSAAVRAILPEQPEAKRIELRRPGADTNPYLALAALIASICIGLESGAEPPPALGRGDASGAPEGRFARLPCSLEEAVGMFESDSVAKAALGEEFSEYFVATRKWEVLAWQQAVSEWERDRYFQIC